MAPLESDNISDLAAFFTEFRVDKCIVTYFANAGVEFLTVPLIGVAQVQWTDNATSTIAAISSSQEELLDKGGRVINICNGAKSITLPGNSHWRAFDTTQSPAESISERLQIAFSSFSSGYEAGVAMGWFPTYFLSVRK